MDSRFETTLFEGESSRRIEEVEEQLVDYEPSLVPYITPTKIIRESAIAKDINDDATSADLVAKNVNEDAFTTTTADSADLEEWEDVAYEAEVVERPSLLLGLEAIGENLEVPIDLSEKVPNQSEKDVPGKASEKEVDDVIAS